MATITSLSGPALNQIGTFNGSEANAYQKLVQELVSQQIATELRSRMVHVFPGNYVQGTFVKGTDRIRYVRYPDISHSLTELKEGVTPDPTVNLSVTTEYFSVKQYGAYTSLSDIVQLDSPHDLVSIAAERVSFAAAKSMDEIVRDVMNAGSARVYYAQAQSTSSSISTRAALAAATTSNIATGDARQDYKLNGLEVKKAVARLKAANVPAFPDGFYRCIIHPNQQYDLLTDTSGHGFLEATKYTQPLDMLNGEIGAYSGVRFLVANGAKTWTQDGQTIYSALFFGPDAFVVGDSQTMQTYFVAPGGDHTDPLSQRALIGYKLRFGAMIMGEAAVSEYSGRDKVAVVTTFARSTTTATITTSAAHGLFAGETVRFDDVNAVVNYSSVGYLTVASVPSATTLTVTVANSGDTSATGLTGTVQNKVPQTSLGQVRYLRLETRATAL
jgi:N4-gp56 family major capsid protein